MTYTKRATVATATNTSVAENIRLDGSEAQKSVDERIGPVAGDLINNLDPTIFEGPAALAVDKEIAERDLVTIPEVPLPAAVQAVQDLARADGWKAVYDPTNPHTRVVEDGKVTSVGDSLGDWPAMVTDHLPSAPLLSPGRFGQLDGLRFGVGGVAQALRTGSFATPKAQPTFVMALGQSRTGESNTGRFLLDGQVGNQRNAILVASAGVGSWTMFANGERRARDAPQDTKSHVIGAQFAGSQYRLFVDGIPQYIEGGGGAFDYPMGALTLGNRYASSEGTFWDGWAGLVLVYDGIPPNGVRERMTRLLMSLSSLGPVTADHLTSRAALLTPTASSVDFQKAAKEQLLPASLTKMVSAWVARKTITDARLDETVTVTAADDPNGVGSTPRLQVGDVISYRDLLYLMMMPSNNAATRVMGRAVGGQLAGSGTSMEKFIAAMNAQVATWGWEGSVFFDTSGLSPQNRMSSANVAELMWRIANNDAPLLQAMSTLTKDIAVAGPNARTLTAKHTINPDAEVKFPEFIAGKTGTYGTMGNVVMLVRNPDNSRSVVVTMNARPVAVRYEDARKVIDGVATSKVSTAMVLSDIASSQNLDTAGSWMRQQLDALYGPDKPGRPESIISRFPGATSSDDLGISIFKAGAQVEITFANVKLPAGFDGAGAIPAEYLPAAPFVYGKLNPDRDTGRAIPVQVYQSGRVAVFGNTATDGLRGTLTWLHG